MSAGQAALSIQVSGDNSSWPIFVISLNAEAERRALCRAAMDRLGLKFEFFDAVSGYRLSDEEIARVYDPDKNSKLFKRPLSKPEIGCYLSHLALWDLIGKSQNAGAIIFEDDFEADGALPALLQDVCELDLSNCLVKLHSEKRVAGALLATLAGGRHLVAPYKVPGLTLAYVVERRAAAALAEKALPFGRPVDMDLKHWWDFGISVLVVQPAPLRIRTAGAASAIESSRKSAKPAGNLSGFVRLVRNMRYQIPYNIQLLRARSKSQSIVRRFKSPSALNR